eukprot:13885969-Alexandrium_andersonii.AAC.1
MGRNTHRVTEPPIIRITTPIAVKAQACPGGFRPPGPLPEKRLRRARRPVSSSPADSARKMTPNPPDETFW